jgi:hypothetical protein
MPLILRNLVVCVAHPPADDARCPEHAPHVLAVRAEKIARILAGNWQKNVQHRARFRANISHNFSRRLCEICSRKPAEFLCATARRRSALEPDMPRPFFYRGSNIPIVIVVSQLICPYA